jgi:hypothetical protein
MGKDTMKAVRLLSAPELYDCVSSLAINFADVAERLRALR